MRKTLFNGALVVAITLVLTSAHAAQAGDTKSQVSPTQQHALVSGIVMPSTSANLTAEAILNSARPAAAETELVATQRWRRPWRGGYYRYPTYSYPYYGYRTYYRYPRYNYGRGGIYWNGRRGGFRIYW